MGVIFLRSWEQGGALATLAAALIDQRILLLFCSMKLY
jgi:hypothetical protein